LMAMKKTYFNAIFSPTTNIQTCLCCATTPLFPLHSNIQTCWHWVTKHSHTHTLLTNLLFDAGKTKRAIKIHFHSSHMSGYLLSPVYTQKELCKLIPTCTAEPIQYSECN
jgi:hypothetical protein